jgi:hypothetical protein
MPTDLYYVFKKKTKFNSKNITKMLENLFFVAIVD